MTLFSRKGRAPQPWDHRLANPYVEGKPATDGREGQLLASVANWQRVCGVLLLIVVGLSVHAYRLGERVQVQTRPYVIEVAETGQVRTVGLLPQQPWQTPMPPTCVFVIKHWLTRVRTVGDSKVLLGQAWEEAMSFTAPKVQPWLREQIAERYTHWHKKEAIQITITSVLPIAQAQQVYKATWEEKPPPPPAARAAPAVAPPQPPKPPSKWLFADVKQGSGVQEPPFPVPKDDTQDQGHASSLFPKAVWARPLDPAKVLYAQQVINGVLASNVHSQHVGIIRVLVTEQVEDRWGQGNVLIPQYTVLLAKSEKVEFGQERLGVSITAAEFPDGTRAVFKGQAGDAQGATGVPGDVDNRWGNIIASAGISALLSIGSRIPTGNPQGYVPSLGQEVSRDVAQSVNQSGQQVVRRELDVSPIIRLKYGDPVSVQLLEPISFQTPPVITTK